MLAGRAVKREMFPLCAAEMGDHFSLDDAIRVGTLPGLTGLGSAAERRDSKFNKGLHSAAGSGQLDRLIGVYLGDARLRSEDVDVFPLGEFCAALFDGGIL
jgi:hypothetical protein